MIDLSMAEGFLSALLRVATPLLLAALGEMLAERAGVINLGVEGAMLAGALAAAIGASGAGPWAGLALAVAAGAVLAAGFAAVAIGARTDQIITGTATTLLALGLTGAIYRRAFGTTGAGLSLPTLKPLVVPGLSEVPLVCQPLFAQPLPTYLALAAVPLLWWFLFRTRTGLALRAVGESPASARAAGVPVRRMQVLATIAGGAFAGLAGGTLVLAQVGTFAERMTAGRGFIAIAIVVLGRWHPVGVLLAALLFGGATALQFLFQAAGLDVPYQLFLMLPYVLTLVLLAGVAGGVRAPAALGRTTE
ncbi:MAG TPA: ABC transporter permease [Gemmatimonadales bacterium]|nr:ABC transporter permease [Gemmatimonadales bacterium]